MNTLNYLQMAAYAQVQVFAYLWLAIITAWFTTLDACVYLANQLGQWQLLVWHGRWPRWSWPVPDRIGGSASPISGWGWWPASTTCRKPSTGGHAAQVNWWWIYPHLLSPRLRPAGLASARSSRSPRWWHRFHWSKPIVKRCFVHHAATTVPPRNVRTHTHPTHPLEKRPGVAFETVLPGDGDRRCGNPGDS